MPAPKLYQGDTTTAKNLSLATSVLRKAEREAERAGMSLSQWVTMAMRNELEKKDKEND